MEILVAILNYLLHPVLLVPIATILLTTMVRKTVVIWKPQWENKTANKKAAKIYCTILHWAQPILGIGFAFACWKVPQVNGGWDTQPWSFILVAGILLGTMSGWIWRAVKGVVKAKLKLTDKDVKLRLSSLPGPDAGKKPDPE